MYSKDQKCGVIFNASDTWTGTARSKCGSVMFTNVFLLYIYLMHGVTPIDTDV